MASSPYFARIRKHVLQLIAAVPAGRLCTFQSIGEYLDVMPRHVAYILSQLEDTEKLAYPWFRVVGEDATLGAPKMSPDGKSQADLLSAEGIVVRANRIVSDFDRLRLSAEDLESGLARQKRPADAPVPKARRPRGVRAR